MAAFLATTAAPASAIAPPAADFPDRDSGYHNYPEMVAEIHEVEAAHPEIVDVFSIGESVHGRDIWAAKVSDNVATDEDEPEVLFDAAHHADEHLTVEQALYLFHELVDDYGVGPKVTRLVDTREIWIVFMLNPDGVQFDLRGDPYRDWRKNRQPNPTSEKVGIDLNRNYGFKWGCCGGSAIKPGGETYRGWEPWAAPETRAIADFVKSRVVDGQQQIRTHMSLHANGELILYPWAYTRRNLVGVDDEGRPRRVQGDGVRHGRDERLPGAAVGRVVHHRRRPDRLDVRAAGDLLVHPGGLPGTPHLQPLPGRREDREADQAEPRGAALPHRPGRLPIPRQRHGGRELRARSEVVRDSSGSVIAAVDSARSPSRVAGAPSRRRGGTRRRMGRQRARRRPAARVDRTSRG